MRKLVFVVLLLALVLPVMASPAQSPMESMLGLVRYFPDDSVAFVAFRTDEGVVDELDALLNHVARFFPNMLPPNFSMRMLYEEPLAGSEGGVTFGEDVRPWLGDGVAVGIAAGMETIMQGGSTPPFLLAAEVKDKEAAVQFVTDLLTANGAMDEYIVSKGPDFTVIAPTASSFTSGVIAINDSVLLIAERQEYLPLEAVENPLSEGETFLGTVGLLPNESYDLLAYVDTPAINQGMMAEMMRFMTPADNPALAALLELMSAAYATMQPQAIGLSKVSERSLVLDAAQLAGDTSQLEALGFSTLVSTAPVDLEFARFVPGNSTLVMMGTGLGPAMQTGIQNLRALGDFLQEKGVVRAFLEQERGMSTENADRLSRFLDLNNFITFGELSFAGMTSLNLEKDVLAWMDGDYAMFLRVLPAELLGLTVDGALVIEANSNPDAARNVMTKLMAALDQYHIPYSGDTDTISFESPLAALASGSMRDTLLKSRELDLLIGVDGQGDVFSMGTRRAVEHALTPTQDSLNLAPAWQAATALFLPDAQVVAYLNVQPLIPVLAPRLRWTQEEAAALSLLESASLTATMGETGSVARFAVTLGQAPINIEGLSGGSSTSAPEPLPTVVPVTPVPVLPTATPGS